MSKLLQNKLPTPKFVDLFCGGGFGARGAVRGGGVPLLGLDAWELATDTYKANFPQAEVLTQRIEDADTVRIGVAGRSRTAEVESGEPQDRSVSLRPATKQRSYFWTTTLVDSPDITPSWHS